MENKVAILVGKTPYIGLDFVIQNKTSFIGRYDDAKEFECPSIFVTGKNLIIAGAEADDFEENVEYGFYNDEGKPPVFMLIT